MELLLVGAVIFCVIYIFIINYNLGEINEQIEDLEDRLTKLEKDAVKITFTGEPKKVPPCVGHELESQKEEKKQTKKRKPKTIKDWEDEFDLGGHE